MAAPVIILVEPQLAENIGTTARAMLNCGLTELRLVNPAPKWPSDRALATCAGADDVLANAKLFRSVAEAVRDLNRLYATTARPRDIVKIVVTPRKAGVELREIEAQGLRAGVLFGPERMGLINDDIAIADVVIAAPLNPEFSSLNLAQAVLLIGYEWLMAGDETPERVLRRTASPPAEKQHLLSFFTRLESELDSCGFLRVAEKRPSMVDSIRSMFVRADLSDQELRTLHGIVTELVTKRVGRD